MKRNDGETEYPHFFCSIFVKVF